MALAFARRSTIVAVLSASLLVGSGAGCSLMFTVPAPPVEERGPIVHCTSSNWAPVLDLVGVGLSVARTVVAFSASEMDYANSLLSRNVNIMVGIGLGASFATSSMIGFRSTAECREVRAAAADPDRQQPSRLRPPLGAAPPSAGGASAADAAPVPALRRAPDPK